MMPDAFQPLRKILETTFEFNLSRIKFLVLLIECLISVRTTNLAVLSANMSGTAKISSHYKRLQRFMQEVVFDWEPTARLLAALSGLQNEERWTLILDRTNWMLGKIHINILYLAVSYHGVTIPLFGYC